MIPLNDSAPCSLAGREPQDMPPGYMRSEFGPIPADWRIVALGDEISLVAGVSVNSDDEGLWDYDDEHAVLKTSAVVDGCFMPHEAKRIVAKDLPRARVNPRRESIIISRMNTPQLVGECGYVDRDYPKLFLPDRLWLACPLTGSRGDVRWLSHLLSHKPFKSRLQAAATGTSGSMKNIPKESFYAITVPLPPPVEQRAIAAALSDVDEALRSLEALIAKKRAIKQAAMQQLLTGRTRLPGFSGEWQNSDVRSIGSTYGGLAGKTKGDFGAGAACYVTFLNVLQNVIIDPAGFDTVRVTATESQTRVLKGDLLFNGTSETPEELAMAAVVADSYEELYLNSFCFGLRMHQKSLHDALFLAYYFRGAPGRTLMRALAQGATRYNISKSQFLGLELVLPRQDEQVAIASVLSDMDAEIAALEARRDKTRAIMQGMRQQLLAGRIRLMKPSPAERPA